MSLATHCIPYDSECSVCNPTASEPRPTREEMIEEAVKLVKEIDALTGSPARANEIIGLPAASPLPDEPVEYTREYTTHGGLVEFGDWVPVPKRCSACGGSGEEPPSPSNWPEATEEHPHNPPPTSPSAETQAERPPINPQSAVGQYVASLEQSLERLKAEQISPEIAKALLEWAPNDHTTYQYTDGAALRSGIAALRRVAQSEQTIRTEDK